MHDGSQSGWRRRWSELEWQTLWYAGACGRTFRATNGAVVEVEGFGLWNHEAGPDFTGAVLRVDGRPEPVHGDIELEWHALDWERHGHAANRRFANVVLHVFLQRPGPTFFTRTVDGREVLQVHLQDALPDRPLTGRVLRAKPGACCAPLRRLDAAGVDGVLETAAQARLERKCQGLARAIRVHGFEQALYQQAAMAFGYKENKLPFVLLSQRAPLAKLRADPAAAAAEGVLFGLSGFLERASGPGRSVPDAAAYLRSLWEVWWPRHATLRHQILTAEAWHLSSTRPSNHPQRRLAALALLVRRWPELQALPPDLRKIRAFFAGLSHPFWDRHYTLSSAPAPRPVRLVGASRASELLANVFIPALTLAGRIAWAEVKRQPAELDNARSRAMRLRLFGEAAADSPPPRYLYQQQGLLQLADDFCAANGHDCAQCGLPGYLEALSSAAGTGAGTGGSPNADR